MWPRIFLYLEFFRSNKLAYLNKYKQNDNIIMLYVGLYYYYYQFKFKVICYYLFNLKALSPLIYQFAYLEVVFRPFLKIYYKVFNRFESLGFKKWPI